MSTRFLVLNSTIPFTHSMRQPSTFAYPFFHGRTFVKKRRLSNYIHYWLCKGIFLHLSIYPMANYTTSMYSIFSYQSLAAFYVMDRGYLDYERLYHLNQAQSFFVIRAKKNLSFRRLYSHHVDKRTSLRCDQTIMLKGIDASHHYPGKLRRIKYYDTKTDKHFVFLTNNFTLP